MSCIFCFPNPLNTVLSREHVIPEAIGGSLVIDSVCKDCNDRLGSEVDTHLVDNFLIKMIRLGLRLEARDGRIPTPLINGRLVGTDEIGSFRVPAGAEKGIVTVRPRVEKRVNESGNVEKHIVAERGDFNEIRTRLDSRASRDGQQMVFRGPEVTTVASPVIEKTEVCDLSALGRAFLKIAFEFAALEFERRTFPQPAPRNFVVRSWARRRWPPGSASGWRQRAQSFLLAPGQVTFTRFVSYDATTKSYAISASSMSLKPHAELPPCRSSRRFLPGLSLFSTLCRERQPLLVQTS